jgi:hypothetical protein
VDVVAEFGPGGVAEFDGFELGGPFVGGFESGEERVEKLKVESCER